jgi:flagellar basal-body rod protein FlgC
MNLFGVFDISSAGMSVEQAQLAIAASNLANSRTTRAEDGSVFRPLNVVLRATSQPGTYSAIAQQLDVAALPRPVVADVVASDAAPRLVYEPGHPDANAQGFVSYPAVDPLSTMMDLMTISRSYEANLRAFDITRTLIQRTLEIGRGR